MARLVPQKDPTPTPPRRRGGSRNVVHCPSRHTHLPSNRPPRREHRVFRPRVARGRHSGRARRGARCARGRRRSAGVGERADFYWTLHAVFVKKHEHSVLFDQAFRIFFRKRGYLDQLMAMMMPQAPGAPQSRRPAPRASRRRCSPASSDKLRRGAARDRDRPPPHRVRSRGAAAQGFRPDVGGRDRARQGRDPPHGARRSTR